MVSAGNGAVSVDAEGRSGDEEDDGGIVRLNLGAADRHLDGFLCVDIAPPPCVICDAKAGTGGVKYRTVDLSKVWIWPDAVADQVMALDVCEHIPNVATEGHRMLHDPVSPHLLVYPENPPSLSGRIHFMNELHRVLVPGGRATIETPNAAHGVGYFQDPTHCSPWCLSTFKYFEYGAFAHQRLSKAYGITAAFKVLSLTESRSNGENPAEEVWKIRAVLEAVK